MLIELNTGQKKVPNHLIEQLDFQVKQTLYLSLHSEIILTKQNRRKKHKKESLLQKRTKKAAEEAAKAEAENLPKNLRQRNQHLQNQLQKLKQRLKKLLLQLKKRQLKVKRFQQSQKLRQKRNNRKNSNFSCLYQIILFKLVKSADPRERRVC